MWSNLQQCAEKSKRLLQIIRKQIFQSFSNFRESGKIIPSNIQAMSMSTQIIESVFLFLNSKIKDLLGLTQLTQALSICFSLLNLICQISVKVLLNYTAENVLQMSFFRPRSKLIKELFDIVEQSKEQPCLKQLSIQERDSIIKRRLNQSESQTVAKLQQIFSIFKCSALSALHVEEMLSNSSIFVKDLMNECLPSQPFVDKTLGLFIQAFRGQLLAIFEKQVRRQSERIFSIYLNSILERCNQCESQTELTSQSINNLQKVIKERESTIFKLKQQRQTLLAKIELQIHQRRDLEHNLKTLSQSSKKSAEQSKQKILGQEKYERFLNSQIFKYKEQVSRLHRQIDAVRIQVQTKNSSLLQLRDAYETLSQDYSNLTKQRRHNNINVLPEIKISPSLRQTDSLKIDRRFLKLKSQRLNYSYLQEITIQKITTPAKPASSSSQKLLSKTEIKNFYSIDQLPDQADIQPPQFKRISSLSIAKKISMDNYIYQHSPNLKPCNSSITAAKSHLQQLVESNFKTRIRSFKQIVNQKKNQFNSIFKETSAQNHEMQLKEDKQTFKKTKKAQPNHLQKFVIRDSIRSSFDQFNLQLQQACSKDPSVLNKLGSFLKKQIQNLQMAKQLIHSFMISHQKCGKYCKHLSEIKLRLGFNSKFIEFNQGTFGPWNVNY